MNHNVGDVVTGIISGIKAYGVFIKFEDTFGFCHISNCSHKFIKNLNELFTLGNEVTAKIIEINREDNKINMSIKDCEIQKSQIKQKKQTYKSQSELSTNNDSISFDDMLKTYLKNSEERLNCIGKRNQKHSKR